MPDSLDLPHLDAPVMRRMSTAKRASATPVTWIENSTFVAQEDTVFPMRPESLLLFDSGAADGGEAPKPLPQANEHVVADHIAAFLSGHSGRDFYFILIIGKGNNDCTFFVYRGMR